ncbi:hypothetical protein GCM10008938_36820 [Deinococcus roseus]|uniref:Mannanase galactose-binding domain-containing protein n=2 Tax=Deinococcus roseus TaxID=392414 RepID=A0ABQ2D8H8_9DEIO|nr:hypothetical protein GCM10008938_36820 [Deinococcus roseus]
MHLTRTTPLVLVLTAALLACNAQVPPAPKAPPTARNDNARMTAEMGGTLVLDVLSNDTPSSGNTLDASTLDLDPQTAGQQNTFSTAAGTFKLEAGKITFTAQTAEDATSTAHYTVQDSGKATSSAASITVTLTKAAPVTSALFSFETGTDGWKPIKPESGSVEQTADFHTDGTKGLLIHSVSTDGDWFSVVKDLSLEGKTTLTFDLKTGAAGTSYNVALQTGAGWKWCQGSDWTWVDAGKTVTASIDLSKVSCDGTAPDLSAVHAINVFFSKGDFYIDKVDAK